MASWPKKKKSCSIAFHQVRSTNACWMRTFQQCSQTESYYIFQAFLIAAILPLLLPSTHIHTYKPKKNCRTVPMCQNYSQKISNSKGFSWHFPWRKAVKITIFYGRAVIVNACTNKHYFHEPTWTQWLPWHSVQMVSKGSGTWWN